MSYRKELIDMQAALKRTLDSLAAARQCYDNICAKIAEDPDATIPNSAYMDLAAISIEINQFTKSAKDELEVLNQAIKQIEI